MSGNIKTIKVDPTGFYINKQPQEDNSKVSVSSDSSSEEEDHSLVHLQNVPSNVTVIKEGGETSTNDNNTENTATTASATATSVPEKKTENDIENYLSVENKPEENETVNSQYSENELNTEKELPKENNQEKQPESKEPPKNEYYSDDDEEVIDMTENKLYEVLASVLEDEQGENVSENLAKLNRNLERHNELMGKILHELINMNREKHKEHRFFEALTRKLNKNSLNTDFETSIQPSDTEGESETNFKKGGRIQRMKNRICTPDLKTLTLAKK